MLQAAHRRGWRAKRLTEAPTKPSRYGFIRPHPAFMPQHIEIDKAMRSLCGTMVQDRDQVVTYDNKALQSQLLYPWQPWTHFYTDKARAMGYAGRFPVVSKAKEGASSVNVRIINSLQELHAHVERAFSPEGLPVSYCADGRTTRQQGYVLLQEFIPHTVTWRVNIIGNRAAIFKRYNYPDRPVAQTGNTEGVMDPGEHGGLLYYARHVAAALKTKWVALDILWDGERNKWALLETSLAWPWTRGEYADVPFLDLETNKNNGKWGDLWDVLYDQLEDGVFSAGPAGR